MSTNNGSGERLVQIERLELSTLAPGTQMLIHLGEGDTFHAILVEPETGKAVVRPWVGGGQRNTGYRDATSTIGTRPLTEGAVASTEPVGEQEVQCGGITLDDELVLRNEEGSGKIVFTGQPVDAIETEQ